MKPSIPELGRIIRLDGDIATILLQGGKHCEGCGAGKLGLCKPSGNAGLLKARNAVSASVGDHVRVGLEQDVQTKGYMLAFIIPLISLIAGSVAGSLIGAYFSLQSMEVVIGFGALVVTLFFTIRRLKRLDKSNSLTISEIVSEEEAFTLR